MKSTEEKTMEDLRAWVHEELEPYFQGAFGTMDTMLEMFIEELTDKLASSHDSFRRKVEEELINKDTHSTLKKREAQRIKLHNLTLKGVNK
jgi:hypothetical protein